MASKSAAFDSRAPVPPIRTSGQSKPGVPSSSTSPSTFVSHDSETTGLEQKAVTHSKIAPISAEDNEAGMRFGSVLRANVASAQSAGVRDDLLVRSATTLEEWVASVRDFGRADEPKGSLHDSEHLGNRSRETSEASSTEGKEKEEESAPSPLRVDKVIILKERAHQALLNGDIDVSLDICRLILQANPADSVALLYEGVALARRGESELARRNMEAVLEMSRGLACNPQVRDVRNGATAKECSPVGMSGGRQVRPDLELAAIANLASFAHNLARSTFDTQAEMLFLLQGLEGAATWELNPTSARSVENDKLEETLLSTIIDIIVLASRAFEEAGQLAFALRLYQRAAISGGHRDPRVLRGLGNVSSRLKQFERELHASNCLGKESRWGPGSLTSDTTADTTPWRHGARGRMCGGSTIQGTSMYPVAWCDWSISHPRPGQLFSPNDTISIAFDLSRLQRGLPAPGRLLTAAAADALTLANGGKKRPDVLGVLVCSYLEDFKLPHCLPQGKLRDLDPGWHVLTAEVYELPGLNPLNCPNAGIGNEQR